MDRSLLEQLPGIVAAGKRQATQVLEQLEGRNRVSLQTRELVIPSKDTAIADLFVGQKRLETEATLATGTESMNRLIYGDNLLAMAALLASDEENPSLRGKVDLIYIDPPFDSRADYRTKVNLPGTTIEQKPTVIEQFAYSDTWADGTASYLAMITPRLILMRELLTESGSIYVHLDWHVVHYVKIALDEIFGKDNFRAEIIWKRTSAHADSSSLGSVHDTLLWVSKGSEYNWIPQYMPYNEWYVKQYYRYSDPDGRKFMSGDMSAAGLSGGGYDYEWKGIRRVWRVPLASMERLDAEGRIFYTKNGMPRMKRYLDESKGQPLDDLWEDIQPVVSWAQEKVGYGTQKPEAAARAHHLGSHH